MRISSGAVKTMLVLLAGWLAPWGPFCHAQQAVRIEHAVVAAKKGRIQVERYPGDAAGGSSASNVLSGGSMLSVPDDGSAMLLFGNAGSVRVEGGTEIRIPAATADHSLEMLKGRLFLQINADEIKKRGAGGEFRLKTPAALLAVKGTSFSVMSRKGTDTVSVGEGTVSVTDAATGRGETLASGQSMSVGPDGLSPIRPLADRERKALSGGDANLVVRTPLMLAHDRGLRGRDEYKAVREGRVELIKGSDYEAYCKKWEHVMLSRVDYSNSRSGRASSSVVTDDGSLQMVVPYHFGASGNHKFIQSLLNYYIIGPSWRVNTFGLPRIGSVMAVSFRFRCKGAATFSAAVGSSDLHKVTFTAPDPLPADGYWSSECVVPLLLKKSGLQSSSYLSLDALPAIAGGGGASKVDVIIEVSDFALISEAK